MEKLPTHESKESLDYRLSLTIHRHGPKIGAEGPLSEEGKEVTEEFFNNAYDGITMDTNGTKVEHSPIHRAKETALLYSQSIERTGSGKTDSITEDERLSEGGVAENKEVLQQLLEKYGRGGRWVKGWLDMKERPSPEVKTGAEAVADFSSWLLEKVDKSKKRGGEQEIDAFSHGPVILAFLIRLQEKSGQQILPEGWEDQDVFSKSLNYLSSLQIWTDSNNPEIVTIGFSGKNFIIPIEVIEKL